MEFGYIFNEKFNSLLTRFSALTTENVSVSLLKKIVDVITWTESLRNEFFLSLKDFVEKECEGKLVSFNDEDSNLEYKFHFEPEHEDKFRYFYNKSLSIDKEPSWFFTLKELEEIGKSISLSVQDMATLKPLIRE